MKAAEIKRGGTYRAGVSGKLVDVRVLEIVERWDSLSRTVRTRYNVLNLSTGRRITFRSAQRFRREVTA